MVSLFTITSYTEVTFSLLFVFASQLGDGVGGWNKSSKLAGNNGLVQHVYGGGVCMQIGQPKLFIVSWQRSLEWVLYTLVHRHHPSCLRLSYRGCGYIRYGYHLDSRGL